MKMVKSLLLGSAAGLVAVAGAQAADLPVKAKPVEYVKVCSLYGAGFWYVPGTDTCLKIGSYVRVQTAWDADGGGIPIGMGTGGGQFTRVDTSEFNYRTRAALSVDLRTQTEYGTLRSYIEVGAEYTTASSSTARRRMRCSSTAASSSSPGSRRAASGRTSTSTRSRPTATRTTACRVTPARPASTASPIRLSSATASRPRCRSKTAAPRWAATTPAPPAVVVALRRTRVRPYSRSARRRLTTGG